MRLDCSASKERVKLSTKESLVLELRLQGWKIREIAAQPGVEVGTIKREIFRAKTKLAKAKHR
jgi:DNA-directed RNA polymerase specialized sigma24 family protein